MTPRRPLKGFLYIRNTESVVIPRGTHFHFVAFLSNYEFLDSQPEFDHGLIRAIDAEYGAIK